MTVVKCNCQECDYNMEGDCLRDEVELDNTNMVGGTVECMDYDSEREREMATRLFTKLMHAQTNEQETWWQKLWRRLRK